MREGEILELYFVFAIKVAKFVVPDLFLGAIFPMSAVKADQAAYKLGWLEPEQLAICCGSSYLQENLLFHASLSLKDGSAPHAFQNKP